MINFVYLIILCLFLAIMLITTYKYFRYKKWLNAIFSCLYLFFVVLFSYVIFFTRTSEKDTELSYFWHLLTKGNILAIFTLLLQIGLIVYGVINYIKILGLEKNRHGKMDKKKIS